MAKYQWLPDLMKASIEVKALALGMMTSLIAVGLAFTAGAVLQKLSAQRPAVSNAASSAASTNNRPASAPMPQKVAAGRSLFLKNCAHCHGDDARGDEGPDLHGLRRSDEWIARRIRNGIKGEMTAFGEKFSDEEVAAIVAYLRTLR